MTVMKKIDRIKITDEYGMTFPAACGVIYGASETTQTTLTGNDETGSYDEDESVKAIAYEVNYWYDPSKKAQGFRSRPLVVEDSEGNFTRVLEVDLTHASVVSVLNSELPHNEKILKAAQVDLECRAI